MGRKDTSIQEMAERANPTDLASFEEWAISHGHFRAVEMVENYKKYCARMKELLQEANRARVEANG